MTVTRRRRAAAFLAIAPLTAVPALLSAAPAQAASGNSTSSAGASGSSGASPNIAAKSAATIAIDFGKKVRPVSPYAFGVDVTGYGSGSYITADAAERAMLQGRYGVMRMELKFATPGDPSSPVIAGGAGADTTIGGDAWVRAIKSLGAAPVVIVPANPVEAAALVRHFNSGPTPNPVGRWIIGNEPDPATQSAAAYGAVFNTVYDAMKAVDPTIKVGGPGHPWPDVTYLAGFLAATGSRIDFVDFHKYGMGDGTGGSTVLCDSDLLAQTGQWETDVNAVRGLIARAAPARAGSIDVEVGEMNTAWGAADHVQTSLNTPAPHSCANIGTAPVQYRNTAIWWAASAWGHVISAGGIGMQFGDKNGALGLVYDQANADRPVYAQNGAGLDERMPVYEGMGFFTGQQGTGLVHFGANLVAATTSLPDVEVFASSDPNVVVIVNKGTTAYTATLSVGGGFASATGFQKDGSTVSYALPTSLGTLPVTGGQVSLSLAAPSVTQLVFAKSPSPTPTPPIPPRVTPPKVKVKVKAAVPTAPQKPAKAPVSATPQVVRANGEDDQGQNQQGQIRAAAFQVPARRGNHGDGDGHGHGQQGDNNQQD